ncbi:unnamed protein product [Prorocentrum cordatum]|uniref:EF-hand domain-containing protein n=1 Tax=Prorocentrum cordatum TaxID=2364126 RepID=A0ABN9XX39_9DINO|nr:unnamed protein product [Polarella glacialis]
MKDSVLLAQEHSHQEAQHFDKLAQLCHQADEDCNGRLGPREFKNALRKNDVPTLLKMLGFQRHHVCEFFNHMAHESDDNEVDINDFIKGCTLMKGYATTFDLHKLYARVTNVQKDLDERLGEILRLLHNV